MSTKLRCKNPGNGKICERCVGKRRKRIGLIVILCGKLDSILR